MLPKRSRALAQRVRGGGRVDFLHAKYTDPAGFLPGDTVSIGLPNGNLSVVFAPATDWSTYATFNYSQNPVGSTGNGGGITTAGNDMFLGANLRNKAFLYEVGAKHTGGLHLHRFVNVNEPRSGSDRRQCSKEDAIHVSPLRSNGRA